MYFLITPHYSFISIYLIHTSQFDSVYFIIIFCLGFARQCDDTANDGLGSLKTLVGTPTYLSPEIARRSPHYGSKTDMWSFGVILYVLIAGFPPFSDNEQHALFRKICKCEYK